jgi:hypothetical protein
VLRFGSLMIPSRLGALVLALVLAVSGPAWGQLEDGILAVTDGRQVRSIARLVNGSWIGQGTPRSLAPHGTLDPPERLMVGAGLRVSSVRAVAPGSSEWTRLTPTILDLFARREREQQLASDRTSDAPRAVDWIYAAEKSDSRTYYFEASRRVASLGDPDDDTDPPGTIRVAVAGFLHDVKQRLVPLGTKSELRWEQDGLPAGPIRPDLMPLGIVGYSDRSVWVMKGQSGESCWFTLYEVGTAGTNTALTVRPASC